jgi:hypothetical protein
VNRVNLQSNSHAMGRKYCIVMLVAVRSMNTRIATPVCWIWLGFWSEWFGFSDSVKLLRER